MFEKYKEYKDSGVSWLGEVPENWEVKQLKFFARIQNGQDYKLVESEEGYKVYGSGGVFKYASQYLYDRPSVLLGRKGTVDKPIFVNERFWTVDTMFYTEIASNVNPRFFFYQCLQLPFSLLQSGSTIPSMTQFDLGNSKLCYPSLPEQTAIANFLDRKTAQIDQAISIKEKQIELLKERRQILIHNAVTRGLDPDVKMKDSGVGGGDRRWIGEIPEHWEILANRVLFTERNQPGREGLPLLSVSIHTAISSEELDEESNIRGKIKIEDKSNYKLVEVNDIVFNMMRAWQGAIGAVRVKGMVSPAYVVAKPNKKLDANYAEYQYRTSIYIQEMNRVSKGITDFRKRLYWHEFKQLTTILPPFEEQKEIASYIENISEKIATAISLKQKEIEKLKEYKSTLINSAVTGKIKVSKL